MRALETSRKFGVFGRKLEGSHSPFKIIILVDLVRENEKQIQMQ